MNWLAAAIFAATVLYLIDKNNQWGRFWKVSIWLGKCAIAAIIWGAVDHYVADRNPKLAILAGFIITALLYEFLKVKSPSVAPVVCMLLVAFGGLGYYFYDGHRAQTGVTLDFSKAIPLDNPCPSTAFSSVPPPVTSPKPASNPR